MSDGGVRPLSVKTARGRSGLMAWYRYVPLALLLIAVVLMGALGLVIKDQPPAPVPAAAADEDVPSTLPEICSPGVDQGLVAQPWSDPALFDSSETEFQAQTKNADPVYVLGRDGWAFWNDGQIYDLSQSVGRVSLDDAEADAWARYFSTLQDIAADSGSSFYVVIAPAKWDVYPQQLPDWAQSLRGTVSFDTLLAKHPELPVIDTRAGLREASTTTNTYTPLNSHWNEYGAYVAWDMISQCFTESDPALAGVGVPEISTISGSPDHNEYAAQGLAPKTDDDWKSPDYEHVATTVTSLASGNVLTDISGNIIDLTLLPVATESVGAQSDRSLLVVGDSTVTSLSPLMSQSFAHTVMYQHNIGVPSRDVDFRRIVAQHPSDVTLYVMTERYLGFPPPIIPGHPAV
jgi:hypothetical protein